MKQMIAALCFFAMSLTAQQTGTLTGRVEDSLRLRPLNGVKVHLLNTDKADVTDPKGYFRIDSIPPGLYSVEAFLAEISCLSENVRIQADSVTVLKMIMTMDPLNEPVGIMAERVQIQCDLAVPAMAPQPMMYKSAAGIRPDYNTEDYAFIEESGFFETLKQPLSTFSADVDAASYANVRRKIMSNRLPEKDAVRIEELINYFQYQYESPQDHPLSVTVEYGVCPWNHQHHLAHIGLLGESIPKEKQKASNLVFLLDVSGSMRHENKLPLLKKSFELLINQLSHKDKVAIVTYAGSAGLVLPSTQASKKERIKMALNHLQAGGSTAGGQGIRLAYKVAAENYIKGGNNRIILATDGDFNVGISSTSELVRYVENQKEKGVFLTILGFGMGNYKDGRLQEIAGRGNGTHGYIDNLLEAKKLFVNELTSTLYTIAKDVKIQVEFNPAKVKSYRLLGYENRKLENKDFKDDEKDAGEIGAGHTVTALYEIVPAGEAVTSAQDLKYQSITIKDSAMVSDEVLTVRIRYKKPDDNSSQLMETVLKGVPKSLDAASEDFKFSAAVAGYGMLLRDSEYKGNASLGKVLNLAKQGLGKDGFGYRHEFLKLAERTLLLRELE